jgi:UDP-GlcNAc3NAcA epimerase
LKIVTIVGARPQFIKCAMVSRAIQRAIARGGDIEHVIVHTGQHFDDNMSRIFFDELEIPQPDYNLGVAGLSHGAMTGAMLQKIETVLMDERPDRVIVYGDTNSTLAGALAAAKLNIPIAHVEAGLRSFNMRMPEEINRIVADRISDFLFCPTERAVEQLRREGITDNVHNAGDVMYDAVLYYRDKVRPAYPLDTWNLKEQHYALCTVHRAENTDDPQNFTEIWNALTQIARSLPVVLPLHPRTRKLHQKTIASADGSGLRVIEPVSYLEMMRLEMSAAVILTDSGGVQKEAFFHRVPCLTLREETEWVETTESGWNILCGADRNRILGAWAALEKAPAASTVGPYGDGNASDRIVQLLEAR